MLCVALFAIKHAESVQIVAICQVLAQLRLVLLFIESFYRCLAHLLRAQSTIGIKRLSRLASLDNVFTLGMLVNKVLMRGLATLWASNDSAECSALGLEALCEVMGLGGITHACKLVGALIVRHELLLSCVPLGGCDS